MTKTRFVNHGNVHFESRDGRVPPHKPSPVQVRKQQIPIPGGSTTHIEYPINVVPFEFDPFGTNLVRANWMTGSVADGRDNQYRLDFCTFTDPACTAGHPKTSKPGSVACKN